MRCIFLWVLLMQMTGLFSQTRLSGVVHAGSSDHVIIQFWKDFSLISDTIPLVNRRFSKVYSFQDPVYLSIAAKTSTQLLLLMPGENLHVHFLDNGITLAGSSAAYNSFLMQSRSEVGEMIKLQLDVNLILDTMLARSSVFFKNFAHKDASIIRKLTIQSLISSIKLYPLLIAYNNNKYFLDTLKMVIRGEGSLLANADRWKYISEIDFSYEGHRYDHQYVNMISNIARMMRFQAVNTEDIGPPRDPYQIEIEIVKTLFPPSLLRTTIMAHQLFSRINYYTQYPAFLTGIPDFIELFKQEDHGHQFYELLAGLHEKIVNGPDRLKMGGKAPQLNLRDSNGRIVTLSQLKNKIVYLDIWATWCAPCLKELPYLEELRNKYANKNIAFVSISIDTDKSLWLSKIAALKLGGIQLIDSLGGLKSRTAIDYRIHGVPFFVLIDKNGKIADAAAPRPSQRDEINKAIESLLN